MGQRTAILVRRNFGDGTHDINLIHHQWGFGKTMPCLFAQEFLRYAYPLDRAREITDMKTDNLFSFSPLSNENNNYIYNSRARYYSRLERKYCSRDVGDLDVFDHKTVTKLFEKCDNNNGGMIVEVTESALDPLRDYAIRLSFLKGPEDCYESGEEEFSRFISAREYMKEWPDYCPEEFIASFELFLETFDIEQITDKACTLKMENK